MANNFLKKRDAFTIAKTYGFFPTTKMRFEMERNVSADDWGFFANKSNRILIHIKFESNNLEHE